MIDYIIVIFKNYKLIDLQIYNFTKRFNKDEYRVIFIDNTPNKLKQHIGDLPENFLFISRDNPLEYEVDTISHGKGIDFGLKFVNTDIVCIMDSDFFILKNEIHSYVKEVFKTGVEALGTDLGCNLIRGYPVYDVFPVCFCSYYLTSVARLAPWSGSLINNPINTVNYRKSDKIYPGCLLEKSLTYKKTKVWRGTPCDQDVKNTSSVYRDESNNIIGIHYVAGSHRRWTKDMNSNIIKFIDSY